MNKGTLVFTESGKIGIIRDSSFGLRCFYEVMLPNRKIISSFNPRPLNTAELLEILEKSNADVLSLAWKELEDRKKELEEKELFEKLKKKYDISEHQQENTRAF
jgi:hypothetical protein